MKKNRLEAFSDGVIAIIITIMVLNLHVPRGTSLAALQPEIPILFNYALSFVFVGVYWNNHHHLIHAVEQVSGGIMWANLHLLFWLSLIPFVTGWMGENHFAPVPTATYGAVMVLCAIAYIILQWTIIRRQGNASFLAGAIGRDRKGKFSMAAYVVAIAAAFVCPWISIGIYMLVAMIWFIPDRRIERALETKTTPSAE